MDFTVELSKSFNLSPFNILEQDKDRVIMMINYFLEKTNYEKPKDVQVKKTEHGDVKRVKVNDKTATGGWF